MKYFELREFGEEIFSLKDFFMNLATEEGRVHLLGYRVVANWDEYKAVEEIKFERKMHAFVDTMEHMDARLFEQNKRIVDQGYGALEIFARVKVNVGIASKKSHILDAIPFFAVYRNSKMAKSILKESGSIQDIIIVLDRLGELIKFSSDICARHYHGDNEVFEPSNIDRQKVVQHIDQAIDMIEHRVPLSNEKRKALLCYLFEVKEEISETRPSWRKVVGALVIAATITGGIADASQAYDSIKSALDHIMGFSIVRDIPEWTRALPFPSVDGPE